jgi:hypothetical protein
MSVPSRKIDLAAQPDQSTATEIAELRATNAALTSEVQVLRNQLAERERDAPPKRYEALKRAAGDAGVLYDRARNWHHRRWIDSYQDGAQIYATEASIIQRRVLMDGR